MIDPATDRVRRVQDAGRDDAPHLPERRTVLGYTPVDNAETHAERLRSLGFDVGGEWEYQHHGGVFAARGEMPDGISDDS